MAKKYSEEFETSFTPTLVMEEASRCLLCLDAPCTAACPAGTDPAKFIRSVRFRNFKGAAEIVRINNPLGAICARVCPTEKYCQLGCSRSGIDKPIDIGRIQKYITDFEDALDMDIYEVKEDNGMKVAIIGSGPSGLSLACILRRDGYQVKMYEKEEKAGGYLRYGIPEYRLPTKVVDKEIQRILDLGVELITNVEVGKDIKLETLEKENDAVVLAIGTSKGKMLDMFKDNKYTRIAVNFLKDVKENEGKVDLPDNVLVIGGGDVAMDVITTLKMLGVKNVTDVVYETLDEFKASKKELETARELKATIIDGYVPTMVEDNVVTFKHRIIDSEIKIKTDMIILAVGQYLDLGDIKVNATRNEVDNELNRIPNTKVFVAGDIAKGDKTVVGAVRSAKEAATYLSLYLGGKK